VAALPFWLFEESYHTVGDLGETIALLLPDNSDSNLLSHHLSWYLEQVTALEKADESTKKKFIVDCWKQMNKEERFVFNKLLTGSFRIGVSQKLMVNALAKTVNTEASVIAHRISGNWHAVDTEFLDLVT
jgi:DNA ligase-1